MNNDCENLTTRMSNIENPKILRVKRIQKEYNEGKPSPIYYKNLALKKIDNIIKESQTHEDFKFYIIANPQEFSEDERNQIQCLLDTYLNNAFAFYRKKEELMA